MTDFGELRPDGTYRGSRTIKRSSMAACPYFIFEPVHYRADETCRCDDPDATEMRDWGYDWDGKSWVAPEEEDS